MSDIPQEWIDAGAAGIRNDLDDGAWRDARYSERVLAAVLPLIAQRVRAKAGDPRPDSYMRGYYEGLAQGHLDAADLIWKAGEGDG